MQNSMIKIISNILKSNKKEYEKKIKSPRGKRCRELYQTLQNEN